MLDLAVVSQQPGTPPPAIYAPGTIRTAADRERATMERFVARYPEYAKLPPDTLVQYAATYRDDKDHALEQEYRDNGVLQGARVDYSRPEEKDWDVVLTSDNAFSEEIEL